MSGTATHHASQSATGAPVVQHLPPRPTTTVHPGLPVGVAVLSFLLGLAGLLLMLTGALAFLHLYTGSAMFSGNLLVSGTIDEYGAAILLILGAAIVALARALWDQELWALYLMVVLLFAGMAYEFFTASITVLFLVLIALFVYLLAVRHHFY
jgi:hypothetical protein